MSLLKTALYSTKRIAQELVNVLTEQSQFNLDQAGNKKIAQNLSVLAMSTQKSRAQKWNKKKWNKQKWSKSEIRNRLVDSALAASMTAVVAFSQNHGVRASLSSLKKRLTKGKAEEHEIIDVVFENTDSIIAILKMQGVSIKRVAVDGVPGSGKSTLARALAQRLGFTWKTLDYIDLDKPQNFNEEKMVFEHHRLLRTQDIDCFDAIVYIDEPVENSKEKCIHRKRGGINIDVFDYEKLKQIGKKAFEITDGKTYLIPNSNIKMKIKPLNGFKAYENIKDEAEKKGLKAKEGRSKEKLLFFSVYGKVNSGLRAYVNLGAYNKELKEGISAGISRFFAN